MKKIIIIKYAELNTKKDNINFFIKTLKKNIELKLEDEDINITYDRGRMFILVNSNNFDLIVSKLQSVFGIHEIIVGYELSDNTWDNIVNTLKALIADKEINTFKIETKRSNKNYPLNSMEINKKLGEVVLKTLNNTKVDVINPEILINIEIRLNQAYIYFEKKSGIKGYPVGTLGKGMLMLSGGIDSPVAGYLAMKRGVKLEAILFESPPHTSEMAKDKVIKLAKKLALYNNDIKLHIINFTEIQTEIYKKLDRDYLITIMRRMMYRISERIAYRNNCKIVINGESIGQVASQTLTSMAVINHGINIPIIRPLACFYKYL